ncbi:N-acetylmuramoyl-L-alanine amidase [Paenibacillus cremeus]|uniref:N-acetylmuramoyl-L-alanine amidase n=1 Tax=Paenibacillus cremeus TaxID=2163881 RepID=A0A559KIG2_9BACL|nr:N-acetylmuramoyl-L-alanine amidase [Paenibacillus cremeus]TVY11899.1 N-acetylmuramoyl-L-alanine amidase [Paenibacillus cremeus]
MKSPLLRLGLLALGLLIAPGPASAAKIVVDAGHGGTDSGAIGVNQLQEKEVTLDIAGRLRDLLVQHGYEVAMSRTTDTYVSLSDRVAFTNAQNADLFVSIHANEYSSPTTRGAMVLYYDDAYPQSSYPASDAMRALTPQSKALAQDVLDSFVGTTGLTNRGLVESAVYVVRMGQIPSILVETAFLSNQADAALLADSTMRQTMAQGIARGIEAYLPTSNVVFPDTLGHWAREAILRLKAQGIVDGVGRSFEPNRALTRAEWVTLLGRVFDLSKAQAGSCSAAGGTVAGAVYGSGAAGGGGCEPASAGAGAAGAAAFRDANAGSWAFTALDKAVKAGVLEGYPDGTLRPDRPVTRAEVAAMFQRLAGPALEGTLRQPFKDVPPSYWAAGAVAALTQAGWVNGMTANQYMPERSITRAEATALLDRYLAANPKK